MIISFFVLIRLFLVNSWSHVNYLLVFLIFLFGGLVPLTIREFSFVLFFDTLSLSLIVLTCFLMALILLGRVRILKKLDFFYSSVLFFLLVSLVIRFSINRFF